MQRAQHTTATAALCGKRARGTASDEGAPLPSSPLKRPHELPQSIEDNSLFLRGSETAKLYTNPVVLALHRGLQVGPILASDGGSQAIPSTMGAPKCVVNSTVQPASVSTVMPQDPLPVAGEEIAAALLSLVASIPPAPAASPSECTQAERHPAELMPHKQHQTSTAAFRDRQAGRLRGFAEMDLGQPLQTIIGMGSSNGSDRCPGVRQEETPSNRGANGRLTVQQGDAREGNGDAEGSAGVSGPAAAASAKIAGRSSQAAEGPRNTKQHPSATAKVQVTRVWKQSDPTPPVAIATAATGGEALCAAGRPLASESPMRALPPGECAAGPASADATAAAAAAAIGQLQQPPSEDVSAQVGAALAPEMAARLKKKIRIIQPISRTWVEEMLQSSSGTGNASSISGDAPAPQGTLGGAAGGPGSSGPKTSPDSCTVQAPSVGWQQQQQQPSQQLSQQRPQQQQHVRDKASGSGRAMSSVEAALASAGCRRQQDEQGGPSRPSHGAQGLQRKRGGSGDAAKGTTVAEIPHQQAVAAAAGNGRVRAADAALAGQRGSRSGRKVLLLSRALAGAMPSDDQSDAKLKALAEAAEVSHAAQLCSASGLHASLAASTAGASAGVADTASPFSVHPFAIFGGAVPVHPPGAPSSGMMLPPPHSGSGGSTGVTASATGTGGTPGLDVPPAFGSLLPVLRSGSGVVSVGASHEDRLQSAANIRAGSGSFLPCGGSGSFLPCGGSGRSSIGLAATPIAGDARSKASLMAASGALPQPVRPGQPRPGVSSLGKVQGELTLLYQWYVANKNVYLDQAQRQLQRVEALTAAVERSKAAAGDAGGAAEAAAAAASVRAESAEALRAFETALKIMRVCGSVEQQWLGPQQAAAMAPTLTRTQPIGLERQGSLGTTLGVTGPASAAPQDPVASGGAAAAAAAVGGREDAQVPPSPGCVPVAALPSSTAGPVPLPVHVPGLSPSLPHGAGAALAVAAALVGSVARGAPGAVRCGSGLTGGAELGSGSGTGMQQGLVANRPGKRSPSVTEGAAGLERPLPLVGQALPVLGAALGPLGSMPPPSVLSCDQPAVA